MPTLNPQAKPDISRQGPPYAVKVLALMILYIITGKLGLMLSVPPGFATIIWPPSGLALGICLVHGRRLWPGVFLGSFLLNAHVAGVLEPSAAIAWPKLMVAAAIAGGSTIQVLLACVLAGRFVGRPLKLNSVISIFRLFVVAGPVACVTAASVGVLSLRAAGMVSPADMLNNWLSWWGGDVFGVIVFLPLALVAPGNPHPIGFGGDAKGVGRLSALALFLLLIPLGLSFYAWKIASISEYKARQDAFEALTHESEKALRRRLESYNNALVGAQAFWTGQDHVSHAEWKTYVTALDIKTNYPGMSGLGFIQPAGKDELAALTAAMEGDGIADFAVHPEAGGGEAFVITYVEPVDSNRAALGLNIAFEPNRASAARTARDSGRTTLTKKVYLVQDRERTPGFLLLAPLYASGHAPATVAGRRADLKGWIYAPFVARNLLSDLTRSQGSQVDIEIYDQAVESQDALIYRSFDTAPGGNFTARRSFQTGQTTWLIVWKSTKAFDYSARSVTPTLILGAGLLFTAMLAVLFFGMGMKDAAVGEGRGGREQFLVPVTVFFVLAAGAAFGYRTLSVQEDRYAEGLMARDASRIEELLGSRSESAVTALERFAARRNGTAGRPDAQWRDDAANMVRDIDGLQSLTWLDARRTPLWTEPEAAVPAVPAVMTASAADGQRTTVTFGHDATGRPVFTLMVPVFDGGEPVNYLAARFDARAFAEDALNDDLRGNYQLSLVTDGRATTLTSVGDTPLSSKTLPGYAGIANAVWTLQIRPAQAFLATQRSPFPIIALVAGLVIAGLCALTVQALLTTKRKSRELSQSNGRLFDASTLNAAILASTKYIVVTTDAGGRVTSFNSEAETALGYTAAEVIGFESAIKWHDPSELIARTRHVNAELGLALKPGFATLTARIAHFGEDTSEWTFVRKDGTRFPVSLNATALVGENGELTGYLGVAEDITERRAQQQALVTSEETFRLAMENAPTGQALVSPDGRWLKVNGALCELLGYTPETLLRTDFQTITHPDDLDADMTLVGQVLSGEIASYTLEKRYIHSDGRIIWGLLSVSLVRKADGTPHYFISQIQDVTERRVMEQMKSEFISTVSHELRTPLTAIRGSLDFVANSLGGNLPQAGQRLIDMARRNCDRLVLLVNDILDIDKITSGTMRFDLRDESVAQLVEQSVALNQGFADKLNVGLAAATATGAAIRVDGERFQQVMTNLISNAVKFSPEGGTVHIAAAPAGSDIRISVRDEGPGIPADFRGRIFGRFAQADSSITRAKGGSGLGLHITKEIVAQMGGTIGYDSVEGEGATFWILFPAVRDEMDRAG
ncbi:MULTISPECIES: CHASE domain-containing protein [Asticcacaulis]|uniref:CHASE domain-containing protein n=1 Tax=Asticcacaulis TaxID=76890 RepID=UPI001AE9984B|nr:MULTISPECIES: CHASE domain-containing protein [Asticcacaulis]MBP2160385.1 PAS domain S-box-containing protein [Asticcacaulis solisilvae]MDR6801312.1 PAS domain S-box-containing protein [Asticcacaulis sp. BE141]